MERKKITEGQSTASLLETHGDVACTLVYNGQEVTFSLKQWLMFCPSEKPLDEMNPQKVEEACQAILSGRLPSF